MPFFQLSTLKNKVEVSAQRARHAAGNTLWRKSPGMGILWVMARVFLATFLIFTLAGCATNPVAESYRDLPAGGDAAGVRAPLLPYAGTTTLQASTDLEGDGENLTRDGYILVGTSVYEGREPFTPAQIIAQGEKVRADVVLYQSGRGVLRAAVPIADRAPPPPVPHQSGVLNAGTPGHGAGTVTTTHQRSGVPNRPGTISTSMVPIDRLPIHSATFWRKRMTSSKP